MRSPRLKCPPSANSGRRERQPYQNKPPSIEHGGLIDHKQNYLGDFSSLPAPAPSTYASATTEDRAHQPDSRGKRRFATLMVSY
jgi:hypothetical protein